ncbi:ferritin family protein [Massilimicrobiota timonensis]|uniref:ferritin-like domain-containing protein n=1 Tax=Massilimicrobiota timonensis TaxID=1776392 RepID=UPI0036F1D1CC
MNYLINKPYPKIQNIQPNPQYASMMLSNLGGLHSEMNAVSLYFYNHIILMDTWPELSEAMEKISIVEMHHLDIFAQLAYQLGTDPRLWDCQQGYLEYWSPSYNVYPCHLQSLLENAMIQEQQTIDIYQKQINCIYNQTIQKILYRIIEDEQLHLQIFESFLNEYNAK